MKYSHSGQKVAENAMRGPKIPEMACSPKVFVLVSTGFVLFVLVDGTLAIAKKGESKYMQNMCFCTVFVLFVLVSRVFVLVDR